jgi:uncharacterized protein YhhL (DUF1145 family)
MFYTLSKVFMMVFYALVPVSLVWEVLLPYSNTMLIITAVLLVLHSLEFILMKNKLQALPGSVMTHFINTLLFGFNHWLPLMKAQKDNEV